MAQLAPHLESGSERWVTRSREVAHNLHQGGSAAVRSACDAYSFLSAFPYVFLFVHALVLHVIHLYRFLDLCLVFVIWLTFWIYA